MLDTFTRFILENKLIAPEAKTLVAISGGVDSMVMADLFRKAGYAIAVAHCNYQLRGEESDQDERFVHELAEHWHIKFYVKRFDTKKYATESGISIQVAARELRYHWFRSLLMEKGFDKVATAHHLNDALETFLFNFTKGTGIAGLHGIKPVNDHIIRPMMFTTRERILRYAEDNQLRWREDSSNQSLHYQRNYIRKEVIPKLKAINPSLETTFRSTLERVQGVEDLFLQQVSRFRENTLQRKGKDIYLDKAKLLQNPHGLILLNAILTDSGFNYPQVKDIWRHLGQGNVGKIFSSTSFQLNIDREYLIISEIVPVSDQRLVVTAKPGTYGYDDHSYCVKIHGREGYIIPDTPNVAALDFDLLQFPLYLRKWTSGDRFQPLGMRHEKKVSDFMIDEKIPLNLKSRVRTLVSNEVIVWLVGYRIDDRFKITPKTRRIFEITRLIHV